MTTTGQEHSPRPRRGSTLHPEQGWTERRRRDFFDKLLSTTTCLEDPPVNMLKPKGHTEERPFTPECSLEEIRAVAKKVGFTDVERITELNDSGLFSAVLKITPRLARRILGEFHGVNRPLTRKEVNSICRDIDAGDFALTHQGIAFRKDGRLQDGQHRLASVAMSKSSIEIVVFFNICDEAQAVSDCGRPRSESDAHRIITGYEITSLAGGVIKRAVRGLLPELKFSRPEGFKLITAYQHGLLDVVLEQFPARQKRITTAGVLGALVRGYYHSVWQGGDDLGNVQENDEQLVLFNRFCEVLRGEKPQNAREQAPAQLRSQLQGALKTSAGRFYGLTCRALTWYMNWERGASIPQDGFPDLGKEIFNELPGNPLTGASTDEDDDEDTLD